MGGDVKERNRIRQRPLRKKTGKLIERANKFERQIKRERERERGGREKGVLYKKKRRHRKC